MIPHNQYNPDQVCEAINTFQSTYNVQVILEPGEAVVYKAGKLVSTILDIIHNTIDIAICDTSATAHMPDILEMPYTPDIINGYKPNEQAYIYRIAGNTCLSGDIIGEYSFKDPLQIGNKLVFEEVLVTAEKRTESLQDLSQAITVLNGEDLDNRQISTFVDISAIAPGVNIAKNEGFKTVITIRGVGYETNQNAIATPSVSYHLDGIYVASPYSLQTDFMDLERIEVLRLSLIHI